MTKSTNLLSPFHSSECPAIKDDLSLGSPDSQASACSSYRSLQNLYSPVLRCLLVFCSSALVSSAVPACFAQTPPSESVKPTETSKTIDAALSPSADSTKTPSSPSSPVASTGATTGRSSPSSADDFIPGSEVLPVPAKTPEQSEEFVKKQKPTMDLAMVLYKNNEYKQALLVLEKLPQTEQVHYYTGLCYKGLGNFRDATTHFAWVAYYAKDPKLKSYAFAAIRSTKPNRKNIKKDPGHCFSSIYTSAEARRRNEEGMHRIKMTEEGKQRDRERSGGY
jgi:hypothetical protein